MNLRNTGRAAFAGLTVGAAALTVVAALTMTGCSDNSTTTHVSGSTTTTAAIKQTPLPTVAEATTMVQRALDPATPLAERESYFQGITADPSMVTKLQQTLNESHFTYNIISIEGRGGDNGMATAEVTVNGKKTDQPVQVAIVYEDGHWKIAKAFVCQGLALANLSSPACPGTGPTN